MRGLDGTGSAGASVEALRELLRDRFAGKVVEGPGGARTAGGGTAAGGDAGGAVGMAVDAAAEAASGGGGTGSAVVSTGWPDVDLRLGAGRDRARSVMQGACGSGFACGSASGSASGAASGYGGLVRGAVHEWIGVMPGEIGGSPPEGAVGRTAPGGQTWAPAMAVAVHLVRRAWRAGPGLVVWIGSAVRPAPDGLRAPLEAGPAMGEASGGESHACRRVDDRLLSCCLFVPARSPAERAWAAETVMAARGLQGSSAGVTAIVLDGCGLDFADIRRLQLAAARARDGGGSDGARAAGTPGVPVVPERSTGNVPGAPRGGGPLVLMLRAPGEQRHASVAATRWLVQRGEPTAARPAWRLHLMRCKPPQVGASVWGAVRGASRAEGGGDAWQVQQASDDSGRLEQV